MIGNINNFLKLNEDINKNNINKNNKANEVLSPLIKIITEEMMNKEINKITPMRTVRGSNQVVAAGSSVRQQVGALRIYIRL